MIFIRLKKVIFESKTIIKSLFSVARDFFDSFKTLDKFLGLTICRPLIPSEVSKKTMSQKMLWNICMLNNESVYKSSKQTIFLFNKVFFWSFWDLKDFFSKYIVEKSQRNKQHTENLFLNFINPTQIWVMIKLFRYI